MSDPKPGPLVKQQTWSPDMYRDEAWLKRKENSKKKRSKSVTDEDLDELKACIELGFGFEVNSGELDPRLSDTLPALELYYAVNKQYSVSLMSKSSPTSIASDYGPSWLSSSSQSSSPLAIISPGDTPQEVKTRLKQWAQVVGCSVRQSLLA